MARKKFSEILDTKGGNQVFKFGVGEKKGGNQKFSKILGGGTKALHTMGIKFIKVIGSSILKFFFSYDNFVDFFCKENQNYSL